MVEVRRARYVVQAQVAEYPLCGQHKVWLVAYLSWVTFAAALNYSVWQLNPGVLG